VANEFDPEASDFPMLIESRLCSRARFWVSLRLDEQLSELEGAMLDAHLAGCAACRAFAGASAITTVELRSAPPESHHAPVSVSMSRRRSARPVTVALTAALLAAAAVAGGFVRNVLAPASESAPAPRPVAVVASTFELNDQARRLWSASVDTKSNDSHGFSI
jgi:hypothetical protein